MTSNNSDFFSIAMIKSGMVKLLAKFLAKTNFVLQKFTPLGSQSITPVGYFYLGHSQHSRASLKSSFGGAKIMGLLGPGDWPLYEDFLYCENLVLVGGYKGNNLAHFLEKTNIKQIHVYEPIPEFAREITKKDPRLNVYVEAIGVRNGLQKIVIAADHSYLASIQRPESFSSQRIMAVQVSDWQRVCARFNGPFTIFMNCEGSEYQILSNLLERFQKKKGVHLPYAIIFQSHIVGSNPEHLLASIRAVLSEYYEPILTLDWAWDIWLFRDQVSQNSN